MERQSHDESKMLWGVEMESVKTLDLTPTHSKLIRIVSKKIEDYSLTYEEYVKDVLEYLGNVSDERKPKDVIDDMFKTLIEKYGEEVRSEQD